MWAKTWTSTILALLFLFKSSDGACEMFKKSITYFMTERTLYWYIQCTDINADFDLRTEIVSKMNSSSQYLEVLKSSIPEVSQGIFQSIILTELKIKEANVQIIQAKAFESCNISTIVLDNNQIRKIKERSFNSSEIYVLSLQNNSLNDIMVNNFVGLTGLRKLNLQNNQIVDIQPESFNDLKSLEELNLSYNKLNNIPDGLLKTLKLLKTIYLNDNFLTLLSTGVFSQCTVLQYLNLQNNYLQVIDSTAYPPTILFVNVSGNDLTSFNLSNLINMDTIDLSRNKIAKTKDCLSNLFSLKFVYLNYNMLPRSIVNESFQHLKNLTIVEIDGNNLEQFDFRMFNNLESLRGVSLADNNLTSVDFSNFDSHLKLLNLSGNALREVKNLSRLQDLAKLELSINSLQEIKYNMFQNMSTLKNLWLRHNLISTLELGCFRDLKMLIELDLSYNKITNVLPGVFTGLKELNHLDISHNNLANFDEDIFHNTKHLTALNIAYNNLNNANIKQMMSHMSWLREIDLNGNNWSCISLANINRENKYITLTHGTSFNVSNVYGIACNNTDSGIHYDKSQYLIDMINFMNVTKSYTKEISHKLSVSNAIFIIMLIVFCGNLVHTKYSSYIAARKQFVYKKSLSEQDIQLI